MYFLHIAALAQEARGEGVPQRVGCYLVRDSRQALIHRGRFEAADSGQVTLPLAQLLAGEQGRGQRRAQNHKRLKSIDLSLLFFRSALGSRTPPSYPFLS